MTKQEAMRLTHQENTLRSLSFTADEAEQLRRISMRLHRLIETLEVAISVLGDTREAALCREMTKTYEETIRGSLSQIYSWAKSKEILGEITVVVSGATAGAKILSQQEIIEAVRRYGSVGMDRKEAISAVALS